MMQSAAVQVEEKHAQFEEKSFVMSEKVIILIDGLPNPKPNRLGRARAWGNYFLCWSHLFLIYTVPTVVMYIHVYI
jgi:hypothetical protein